MTKVLIISDIAPHQGLTAGAVLSAFVDAISISWSVDCVTVGDVGLKYEIRDSNADRVFFIAKPWSNWGLPLPQVLAEPLQGLVQKIEVPIIRKRVQALLNELSPDLVVFAAQCPSLVNLLFELEVGSAKVIGFMWDHPFWWAESHGVSGNQKVLFLERWQKLLENSDVRFVPSEGALSLFPNAKQGSETVVLYPNLVQPTRIEKSEIATGRNGLKFGFAGQLYAENELSWLVNVLAEANWKLHGQDVEMHLFGNLKSPWESPNIHTHGWLPAEEVCRQLTQMDFAVLPYPTDRSMDIISKTSFPSKLALYLAADLPIVVLGGDDSSVAQFVLANHVGLVLGEGFSCEELERGIASAAEMSDHVRIVFEKFFSRDAFRSRVGLTLDSLGLGVNPESRASRRARIQFGQWGGGKPKGRAEVFRSRMVPFSLVLGLALYPRAAIASFIKSISPKDGFRVALRRAYITVPRLAIGAFFRIFKYRSLRNQVSPQVRRLEPEESDWLGFSGNNK